MDKIDELLTRGVDKIYPSKEELEEVLRSGKKLRLYQGFDPTGIELHIGHLVGLRKLHQFQKAGHEVIFLIGDGTGQAGDPSGKTRSREKYLKKEELRKNAEDYVKQASKVVHFEGENAVKIMYNGDWLNKLTYSEILEIADHFTAQQLFERDLFQERIKNEEPLKIREFLYPLFQAYDAVVMNVDVEIGGEDQTFNMLAGRTLVQQMKKKEKFVLTTPLLTDSTGKKIGKTEGNVISLKSEPNDLYGMIMNLTDDVILKGLEYLTDAPMEQIYEIEKKIKSGENPMQFKKRLAFEIVKSLNSEKGALKAQKYFSETHQKRLIKQISQIPTINIAEGVSVLDCIVSQFKKSRSETKRLIKDKAVDINDQTITDLNYKLKKSDILKVGKHIIVKIENH